MAIQLKPGSEVDAYCTSCRTDKVHRVIALVGNTPKRVECLSCKGHHLYRPTQEQKDAAAAHKRASKGEKGTAAARPSRSSLAPTRAQKREEDLVASWEKAIAGKPFDQFKPYRIDKAFSKGDLIRHTKFGEGVVATVVDATKCEILFKDGIKMLAQSTQLSS